MNQDELIDFLVKRDGWISREEYIKARDIKVKDEQRIDEEMRR
jgi:hypothetical protein